MKKIQMLVLCVAMLLFAAGCGESTEWIDESAAMIGNELTDGEFVLEDEAFEFPMPMKDWLDNGWHISNNYTNTDEFTLEPDGLCEEFELFRDDDSYQYVTVVAYNHTTEDAKLEDCLVYSVEIDLDKNDVVLPQGLTKRNDDEELLEAYGEPEGDSSDSSYRELTYFLANEAFGLGYVELKVQTNTISDEPFATVKYSLMRFDEIFEMLKATDGVKAACETYFNAEEKAFFYGDFSDYTKFSIDSEAAVKEYYVSQLDYYVSFLCSYLEITPDYLSEEDYNRLITVAKKALSKVKWEVSDVKENGDTATMYLKLYRTDLLYVASDDILAAMDAYSAKYAEVDFETMSDEDYLASEVYYTDLMISALEKSVDKAGTMDAYEYECEINIDTFEIAEEAWGEIDDILMDTIEIEE